MNRSSGDRAGREPDDCGARTDAQFPDHGARSRIGYGRAAEYGKTSSLAQRRGCCGPRGRRARKKHDGPRDREGGVRNALHDRYFLSRTSEVPYSAGNMSLYVIGNGSLQVSAKAEPSLKTSSMEVQFTEISSYKTFIKNNGYFLWGWTSFDKDFKNYPVYPNRQNNLRKAPLPHFKEGRPASILGGWDIMISKFSDKKKESADFIKFLLLKESQEKFFQISAYDPVIKSFYNDPKYTKKYPEIEIYKKLLQNCVHRPANVDYTKYSQIMSHYFNKAIMKEISVSEALKKCTKAIQTDKLILQ